MTRGVFLTAFGKPGYIYSAFNLAFSIKHFNPDLQVALFCDGSIDKLQPHQKDIFDFIILIPEKILYPNGNQKLNPGRVKTSIYEFLPFDENLVLDVDALALKDIDYIFDELAELGGFYYSHLLHKYSFSDGPVLPHLQWADTPAFWDKYGLKEDTVFPCVNSSFQYIKKGDEAKKLFDQINENFDNPVPLGELKTQWGANQPDELYLDIALAQLGIDPSCGKKYLFMANTLTDYRAVDSIADDFPILSMFGSKEMIRPRFREFYDRKCIEYFYSKSYNHQYKFVYIASDKHANTKPVTVAPLAFQPQATLKTALNPISDSIEIDHTKLIQSYPSPTGRQIQVTNWFNCSFIKYHGKNYFAYRLESKPFCVNIRIGLCELDQYLQPIPGTNQLLDLHSDLHAPHGRVYAKNYHVEDPRLFIFRDELYLSYTDGYQMAQAKIDTNTLKVIESFYIDKPESLRTEKNWIFFEYDNELYTIYNTSPHEVFKMNGKSWEKVHSTTWNPDWKFGTIRGGTSPIRVGDRYVSFFHSAIGVKHRGIEGRQYFMGCYEFEARPPFAPLSISKEPILAGEWVDDMIPRLSNAIFVVFPSGVIRHEKGYSISFGYNDYRCRYIDLTDEEINKNMKQLKFETA